MSKIYEKFEDVHVRGVKVYFNTSDSKYYKESTFVNEVSEEEFTELFEKNMLLVDTNGVVTRPGSLTETPLVVEEGEIVSAVVAFGHTDEKLYVDDQHTEQMAEAEAEALFMNNLLIVDYDGTLFRPVSIKDGCVRVITTTPGAQESDPATVSVMEFFTTATVTGD